MGIVLDIFEFKFPIFFFSNSFISFGNLELKNMFFYPNYTETTSFAFKCTFHIIILFALGGIFYVIIYIFNFPEITMRKNKILSSINCSIVQLFFFSIYFFISFSNSPTLHQKIFPKMIVNQN